MTDNQAFLLYLPVYHQGVANLFAKYPAVKHLFLLDYQDLVNFSPTHKDIHGLETSVMREILSHLGRFEAVELANKQKTASWQNWQLIIPEDEAIEGWLNQFCPPKQKFIKDSIFLRWDRKKSLGLSKVKTHYQLKITDKQTKDTMLQTLQAGEASSDWWRQVGCLLLLPSGEKIVTHNQHLPESQTPYIVGDVRAQFHRGENFELTSAIHAEAAAIARCARLGKPTQNASLYVSDFPCPVCAKLIAAAGIKKLYFHRGYSLLDGEKILQAFGVEIIEVK